MDLLGPRGDLDRDEIVLAHESPILALLVPALWWHRRGGEGRIEFSLDSRTEGGWEVLEVSGEVDIYTAPKLRDRLVELIEGGSQLVAIDLRGVSFMDSTGLGSLVAGLKRMRERDGALALVSARDPVLKVLEITGLDKVFAVHDSFESLTASE